MNIFFSAFVLIFIAEIADKSRLVGVLLATTYRAPWAVFLGMTLGYAVLDGAAVLVGGFLPQWVSAWWIGFVVGILFIGTGVLTIFVSEKAESQAKGLLKRFDHWGPFLLSFVGIAVSEMGDRTQIATAALAAQTHRPLIIFAGTMSALALLNLLTVWAGAALMKRVSSKWVHRTAGVLFLLMGVIILIQTMANQHGH